MSRRLPVIVFVILSLAACGGAPDEAVPADAVGTVGPPTATPAPSPSPEPPVQTDTTRLWVAYGTEGLRWSGLVPGVLTFRGNPTRTYHGSGPVPADPAVVWQRSNLCAPAPQPDTGEIWCGFGWASQPSVFERDGRVWLVAAGLDGSVHFLDAATGEDLLAPFTAGGPAKSTVTIDPEGYALAYVGFEDARLRILAFDRDRPTELWSFDADAVEPVLGDKGWDGSPLVIDDHLFAGGENGGLHVFVLNRAVDSDGRVTVDPSLVFFAPTWDDRLLAEVGDDNAGVETSVSVLGDTLYLANSAGLVQGWDIGALRRREEPTVVFEFWTGDDTDASVVLDDDGFLYVGSNYERGNERAARVGQVLKLDSSRPGDPVVWSVRDVNPDVQSGLLATPAVWGTKVYAATTTGRLLGIDRTTGVIVWEKQLGSRLWGSPVVVDGVLLQGDCDGRLWAFDVSDQAIDPPERWRVQLRGCIESTPTLWRGTVYVGTRAGELYALR